MIFIRSNKHLSKFESLCYSFQICKILKKLNIQFPNFDHLPVNGQNLETIHMKSTFKNGLQNDLRAIRNLRAKTDLIREININYNTNQNLHQAKIIDNFNN